MEEFFATPFWGQIKFQMHTPIIIQRLTTSASVSDTPQQGAHTSCHFRSNEKVRWLEPRHSCRLLKLSKGTCKRAKNLGVWCAWLRTSNAKVGECERCKFCWSGCFNWPMQWYRRVGRWVGTRRLGIQVQVESSPMRWLGKNQNQSRSNLRKT